MASGGSWSVYWYNGVIVSSEISRGLDIFELTPSGWISQNEIDAAKTVKLDYLNAQGQPQFVWPPSFALARAYVDQLERWSSVPANLIASARRDLASAEGATGSSRRETLTRLAAQIEQEAPPARIRVRALVSGAMMPAPATAQLLVKALRDLAAVQ
jgi:hypothetical protein